MRRLRTAPLHHLALAAAIIVAVTIGAVGIAQAVGGGPTPPPKPLAEAVYDAANAPQVQGVTARIRFTNGLLPSGSLPEGSASPMLTGADGRLWLADDGRLRLELQSDRGDVQIVSDGTRFRIYDATSHTVYTGALPAREQDAAKPEPPLTRSAVSQRLADLAQTWTFSAPEPGNTAGQPSYTVRISPKDDGGLLGAAEIAWDAAHGVPLRGALYAQGQKSPVLELTATEISYGKIPAADLAVAPPQGAKTVELNPPAGHDSHGNAIEVHGLAAVQQQVGFPVSAPDSLAGLPRKEVSLARFGSENGALATYGQGLGAIYVLEHKTDGQAAQRPPGDLRLPQVNIDGLTGSELATALGTVVTFDRNGVSYTVAGSVPPLAAENAARGLK